VNRAAYRTEEWKEFYEYSEEKTSMIDYEFVKYNPETKWVFDRVGWSRNDYNMFCNWGFLDPHIFSLAKLKTINELYRQLASESKGTSSSQWPTIDMRPAAKQVQALFGSEYGWLFRLAFLALLLSMTTREPWRVLIVAGTAAASLFIILYLGLVLNSAPLRVSFSVASFLACVMVWGSAGEAARIALFRHLRVILAGVAVATGFGFIHQVHRSASSRTHLIKLHERGIDHLRSMGRTLFVDWAASLHGEVLAPWGGPEKLRGIRLLPIGTMSRTPFVRARLEEFGISDIYRAIYTRDDVYVILMSERFYKAFKAYVKEHYNASVRVVSRLFVPPLELTDGHVIIGVFKIGLEQHAGG
jgi:hypothetical protein